MLAILQRYFRPKVTAAPLSDPNQIEQLYRYWRIRVFLSIVLGYGFYYTTRLSLSVTKKPILDEGILNAAQMGTIGSALLTAYAVGKTVNGFIGDRVDLARFFISGLALSSVMNLLFGVSQSYLVLLMVWAVNGWVQSIGAPTSGVSLANWFTPKQLGALYALWSISHNLGEGFSFIATAQMVEIGGWRWGFWGPATVCLAVCVIMLKTLVDRPPAVGLPPVVIEDHNRPAGKGASADYSIWQLQLEVLRNPMVWILGLSSAFMYVARYAINNWGVLYLQLTYGYSLQRAATMVSLFPNVGIAGTALSGYISDRFFGARRAPVSIAYGLLLVLSMGYLFYGTNGNSWAVGMALGAAGFAIGGQLVFLGGLAALDITSKQASGAALGLIGGLSYFGASLQDLISGHYLEASKHMIEGKAHYHFEHVIGLWVSAAAASLALAAVVLVVADRRRIRHGDLRDRLLAQSDI